MGFIKAFGGAISGTFADQWKDFYAPIDGVPATAGVFPAVQRGTNAGIGENTKGSENIITNGSKIVVPEGTALITVQDGQITGFIAEPGGFEFKSDDQNSQSIFSGDGLLSSTIKTSWERFKFGGQPGAQQLAFYVNLKEIPNNKFGTQSEIYWDDAYFGTQVGAITRGTYTLKIVDPLLFVKNFVPASYLQPNAPIFDFADMDNDAGAQLFNEVVGTLSAAFSNYTNDPSKGNRIAKIQGDQIGFAQAMAQAVENAYQWKSDRGLEIVKTAILAIEYDEDTKELMKDVKKADALSGARGNAFMQQAVARGMQAAGENGGGTGMAFMGVGVNAASGVMSGMQQVNMPNAYQAGFGASQGAFQQPTQPVQPTPVSPVQPVQPAQSVQIDQSTQPSSVKQLLSEATNKNLVEMKQLLDAGSITLADYNSAKLLEAKKLLAQGLITQDDFNAYQKELIS